MPGAGTSTDQDYALVIYNNSIGPVGTLTGQVRNASTGDPIAAAQVSIYAVLTQTYSLPVDALANYSVLLPVDAYTVTGSAYGYLPTTFTGVQVVSGTTVTQNISLTVAPTYVISGYVKDSATNDPLWATVNVIGLPFNPPFSSVQTDPVTGFYSMSVSGGQSYTLTASALLHTAAAQGATPVGDTTVNFNLVATTQNGGLVGYVRNYYTNAPVLNATVTVAATGNPSDQTDANGYFEIFNLTPGTYTATATANLYGPVSISNIQVLSSNVAIRTFLLPTSQLNYDPTQLNKTLTLGDIVTDNVGLVISNTGLGALTYSLIEQPGGFAPAALVQPYAGGPDPFGYTWVSSDEPGGPSYNWIDATGGTALGLADDGEANVTLPFNFSFYTSTSSLLRVGNNGAAFYNATTGDVGVTNYPMTDTTNTPNYFIAPFWDDIDSDTGDVYWMVTGSAPNRQVVIEWYNRPHYSNVGSATFELVLFENGDILYQYQDVNFGDAAYDNGASATVGIRGASATYSLQSSYNTASLHDLYAICFDNPNNTGACGGSGYDAIPWLTELPVTGTLTTGNSQDIQLGWDASVADIAQPGIYTASLKIDNNDPAAQSTSVPVVLTVLPTANQGLLTGVVSTTGTCDVNPAPINNALVYLEGSAGFTQTLHTNVAGQYSYYVDAAQSPFTVTVSYADHPTTTVANLAVTGGGTTTQNFTLRLQKPCLSAQPVPLLAGVNFGLSTMVPLTLSNSGATALTFSLAEGSLDHPGKDVLVVRHDTTAAAAMEDALTALNFTFDGVTDAQFQSMTVEQLLAYRAVFHAGTTGFSGAAGASETKLIAYLDAGGSLYISDNDLGYWRKTYPFYDTYLQAQYVSDDPGINTVLGEDIMSGLTLDVSGDSFPDDFTVRSEGTRIMQYSGGNAAGVKVARNNYRAIYTSVDFEYFAGAANQQEIIRRVMNFLATTDVPWMSEAPITGAVTSAGEQTINVTLDSISLTQPGDYGALLKVTSNDPVKPLYNIPVTLTVIAPPSYGTLNGTVRGLAACDVNPTPMKDAVVYVENSAGLTWTLATNVSGAYQLALDSVGSPITVTASNEAGYEAQTVASVPITAATTTTVDFDLRPYLPCASIAPTELSSTQVAGSQLTKTLVITNTGAGALTYQLAELPGVSAAMVSTRPAANTPRSVVLQLGNSGKTTSVMSAPFKPEGSINFSVDDGSLDDSVGVNDSTSAYQFVWLNRFTPSAADFPFQLEQISVIWPAGQVAVGNSIELVVYADTDGDGDPSNATYLQSFNVTVQVADDTTWNTYTLSTPVPLTGPGDVLIGAIDRFVASSVTPANYPAAIDTTASQGRSWLGWWAADPPTPPVLPPDDTFDTLDNLGLPGNFMIRGTGSPLSGDVPWLSEQPVSGTVPAGSSVQIDVAFTAAPTMTLGTYTATLSVQSQDSLFQALNVPVTLTVQPNIVYSVAMTPAAAAMSAAPGHDVVYTLNMTNTGTVSDTYTMSMSAHNWSTQLSTGQMTMMSGETESMQVTVTVPLTATQGMMDVVQLTVTGTGTSVSSTLTTTAAWPYRLFLPTIRK